MHGRLATALATALALSGCGPGGNQPARVEVADAIVTLPAAAGRPGAAYFRLQANAAVRLTRVASPRAGQVELHEPGMRRAETIALARDEPVVFAPGGRHAMLFGLDPSLRPGERIALTFRFDGAPAVIVDADVRRAGDVHGGH
ncbi:MAG TPA: copper chaperone PCu(A)C [Allosphingosinicella sp.]|nr:copper chaperone PCu(A)C [Allosphingosinicella sp.]